jgi:hypothetical protein
LIVPLPSPLFFLALFFAQRIFKNFPLESYQVKKWLKTKPLDAKSTKEDLNYNPISFEQGAKFII